MSWITLTEAKVTTKLSGPETTALKTAALAAGQTNPLTEILTQITREIRGYVKACNANTLGDGATIPDELEGAAVARIRFELATRLPVQSLLTDDRRDANKQAITLLQQVAACRFTLEQPATATDEVSGSPPSPSISETHRRFDRCDQEGV